MRFREEKNIFDPENPPHILPILTMCDVRGIIYVKHIT
jgi:hypothetical protein